MKEKVFWDIYGGVDVDKRDFLDLFSRVEK
jgi:hypothetical protein